MGVLRSCYSTHCRFDPARPADLRTISYYFADSGAPFIEGRCCFQPKTFILPFDDDGSLGEVGGYPRPWRNGATPIPYPARGMCAGDFFVGIPLGGVWPIGPNGVKACCGRAIPGFADFPPNYGLEVVCAPIAYTETFVGGVGGLWVGTFNTYPPGVLVTPDSRPSLDAGVTFAGAWPSTRVLPTSYDPTFRVWSYLFPPALAAASACTGCTITVD